MTDFYFATGGTLPQNAPSYIPRQADTDLYQTLKQSEFCYVLTSRQMGKSSLMVRVANRLRKEGLAVVVFELTAIGINVTVEQWYEGLMLKIGEQLDLADELDDFWYDNEQLGPLQRLMQALRKIVLPTIQQAVVIFFDEIDVVRSLPFSTDEFFAAIRECYNARTQEPNLQRLTFCLIGVATPSDLIADPRITPFNIGQRIDLTDFTENEAAPLAQGLQRNAKQATALLKRILYWTNGHPYLTQKLCQIVADDNTLTKPAGVDRLCEELFFSSRSRDTENNLQHVRTQILDENKDTAALLDLYRQVRSRKKIRDDDTNGLINTLRLSGLVRIWENYLWVRNRIYFRVFDKPWINNNMPDAEKRRQRAALIRGWIQAGAVAMVIISLVGYLAFWAMQAEKAAQEVAIVAQQERDKALESEKQAKKAEKIAQQERYKAQEAEWQAQEAEQQAQEAERQAQEQKNKLLIYHLVAEIDNQIKINNITNGILLAIEALNLVENDVDTFYVDKLEESLHKIKFHEIEIFEGDRGTFSPDDNEILTIDRKRVRIWDVENGQLLLVLYGHTNRVSSAIFSLDNTRVLTTHHESVLLWETKSGELLSIINLKNHDISEVHYATFCSDSRKLAIIALRKFPSLDHIAYIWDIANDKQLSVFKVNNVNDYDGYNLTISSDCQHLVSYTFEDKTVRLWKIKNSQLSWLLKGHTDYVNEVIFSPNGKKLVTASMDKTARIWDVQSGKLLLILKEHTDYVNFITFSHDAQQVITVSGDSTVYYWSISDGELIKIIGSYNFSIAHVALNPSYQIISMSSGNETILLMEITKNDQIFKFKEKDKSSKDYSDFEYYEEKIQELIDDANKVVPRCLTPEQREQFFLPPDPSYVLIEEGEKLAQALKIEEATEKFKQAQEIAPCHKFLNYPEDKAREIAAMSLIEKGEALAKKGQVEAAVEQFKQAQQMDRRFKFGDIEDYAKRVEQDYTD